MPAGKESRRGKSIKWIEARRHRRHTTRYRSTTAPGERPPESKKLSHNVVAAIRDPVTADLSSIDLTPTDRKFSCKNRLFIGNLCPEITCKDLTTLLSKYGKITGLFLNDKNSYGFVKFDYYKNCLRAKQELDGFEFRDRILNVRLSPNSSIVKVGNLSRFVTNELLYYSFQIFGDVENARVFVNDRGKSKCEGIVEFSQRGYATEAIKQCRERCFFLTNCPQPCVVEPFNEFDDSDGYLERNICNKSVDFIEARSRRPHFAPLNSLEHDYGTRCKILIDLYAGKEKMLRNELEIEKSKLEAQFELARYDNETELLRKELIIREMEKEKLGGSQRFSM